MHTSDGPNTKKEFLIKHSIFQDTTKLNIPLEKKDTINHFNIEPKNDSIPKYTRRFFSEESIDSIFRVHEEREKQYQQELLLINKKKYQPKIDTAKLVYDNIRIYDFNLGKNLNEDQFNQNYLYNIPSVKITENKKNNKVFLSDEKNSNKELYSITEKKIEFKPRFIGQKLHFDWISLILFVSFILLGWIRYFFGKYLSSVVKSTISFQETSSLFRDKNSLSERVFILLNLFFVSNTSIFAMQIAHFYNFDFGVKQTFILYILIFSSLIGLYIFRAMSSWFVGFLFLKQKVFAEYFHNVNIFSKNIGLFLFPIVLILQFLTYEYIGIILYIGVFGIIILYFLQIIRSFQIIIRKKVSIFYMILYLCAFEIAPFLVIYKLLLSLN